MKYYELNSKFTFGKYEGLSLLEVALNEPDYIDFCCINLKHFCLNEETIELLAGPVIKYNLSQEARIVLEKKRLKEQQELDAEISYLNAEWDDMRAKEDFIERLKNEQDIVDDAE